MSMSRMLLNSQGEQNPRKEFCADKTDPKDHNQQLPKIKKVNTFYRSIFPKLQQHNHPLEPELPSVKSVLKNSISKSK